MCVDIFLPFTMTVAVRDVIMLWDILSIAIHVIWSSEVEIDILTVTISKEREIRVTVIPSCVSVLLLLPTSKCTSKVSELAVQLKVIMSPYEPMMYVGGSCVK